MMADYLACDLAAASAVQMGFERAVYSVAHLDVCLAVHWAE